MENAVLPRLPKGRKPKKEHKVKWHINKMTADFSKGRCIKATGNAQNAEVK